MAPLGREAAADSEKEDEKRKTRYRESEEVTFCYYATLMVVPFKVRDCSNFSDKARPNWEQMQDLAIEIRPTPTLKSAGFCAEAESEKEAALAKDNGTP